MDKFITYKLPFLSYITNLFLSTGFCLIDFTWFLQISPMKIKLFIKPTSLSICQGISLLPFTAKYAQKSHLDSFSPFLQIPFTHHPSPAWLQSTSFYPVGWISYQSLQSNHSEVLFLNPHLARIFKSVNITNIFSLASMTHSSSFSLSVWLILLLPLQVPSPQPKVKFPPSCIKRCSFSLIIKEMQIKTTWKYYSIPTRMATINKTDSNKCWQGLGKTRTLIHCWWKCKIEQPLWKSSSAIFFKI